MPAAAPPSCGSLAASVGMPITRPWMSASAPPELPGLIGALVWIVFGSVTPLPSDELRPSALTIPCGHARAEPERVADRHRDVADAQLRRVGEDRRAQAGELETLITARSSVGKVPTSVPLSWLARRRGDGEGLGGPDDVGVGDDVAVRVEDDPGAEALGGLDLDDRRRDLAVDVDEVVLELRSRRRRDERRSAARRCNAGLVVGAEGDERGDERREHENCGWDPESFHAARSTQRTSGKP